MLGLLVAGISTVGLLYATWKCLHQKPLQSYPNLQGKVAIITGSNTGIGFETALDFATRGARVIVAARNVSKGEKAASDIRKESSNTNVVFKQLDLASLRSIEKFTATFLEEESRLDILVNNAGIIESHGARTEDDFEMIFGVNHLGHFHLTNLLLDRLKEAPSARIVTVSSFVRIYRGRFNFDMVNKYDTQILGSMSKTYIESKVANVLFTRGLAKRLKGTTVTVNALHPGFINTQMAEIMSHNIPAWRRVLSLFCIRSKTNASVVDYYYFTDSTWVPVS